jgi:hypothetical protein
MSATNIYEYVGSYQVGVHPVLDASPSIQTITSTLVFMKKSLTKKPNASKTQSNLDVKIDENIVTITLILYR